LKPGGTLEVKEAQKPKLVFVQHWRGALAFWGLAIKGHWSTLDWLRQRAGQASNYASPEEFANELSADLSSELSRQTFVQDIDKGIGIHFTAYEHIDEYWIPELFLVSNFTDPSYTAVQNVVGVSRQTYSTLKKIPPVPEHRNRSLRMEVFHKCRPLAVSRARAIVSCRWMFFEEVQIALGFFDQLLLIDVNHLRIS
jgi:hypothetical protein